MAGNFIWYELMTNDLDAAERFYSAVVGFTVTNSGQEGMDYRQWSAPDGSFIGGMMKTPDGAQMPPCWLGYLYVPDVDAAVSAITAEGGQVYMPKTTLPNVGDIAMVTDPQGAAFYVMTPQGEGESTAFQPVTVGHCGWNELHTKDGNAAADFYFKHFGWTRDAPMDMGPMGTYHLFSIDGVQTGGMMTDSNFPQPAWLYYLNVDDINAAKARVEAAGGTVIFGPQEVPGPMWVLNGQDPQGAMFSLVASK
jgi:predicted enzyme related to lactoylglutathione lyase